ncbi:MAG: DMT family transporter [Planctomycetota bacterium]
MDDTQSVEIGVDESLLHKSRYTVLEQAWIMAGNQAQKVAYSIVNWGCIQSVSNQLRQVFGKMGKTVHLEGLIIRLLTGDPEKLEKYIANPSLWMICGAASFTMMGGMANALGTRCDWRIVAQSRTIFSFLVALTLARMAGAKLVFLHPRILWLRSIAGTLSLMSTFYALSNLPLADALTLTNTYPLWIVLIGFVIWGETVDSSILVAIASAIVGVVLIQQPHLEGNRLALASALSAATFTGFAMIGLNRLGEIDPRAVVTHFSGVAAISMIPVLMMGEPVDWSVVADSVTCTLLLGVGITGTIGQICLTKAYATGSAPKVALVGMSQIAMGLVFDIIYREQLPARLSLVGMVLVVGPVMWVMLQGKGRPHVANTVGLDSNEVVTKACDNIEMQVNCISGSQSPDFRKSKSMIYGLSKPDTVDPLKS